MMGLPATNLPDTNLSILLPILLPVATQVGADCYCVLSTTRFVCLGFNTKFGTAGACARASAVLYAVFTMAVVWRKCVEVAEVAADFSFSHRSSPTPSSMVRV
jgi:hypothetical protein